MITKQEQEIERMRGIISAQQAALNHWRKQYDHAVIETASNCADLASDMSLSYGDEFPHAVGAEAAACAIRNRYGLAIAPFLQGKEPSK